MTIGTSERGKVAQSSDFHICENFKHAIIFFGGPNGLEKCVLNSKSTKQKNGHEKNSALLKNPENLFDYWINTCHYQGSNTIRTEVC